MANIIKVKELNNKLEFDGPVLDLVSKSTNFYLEFDLSEEWESCSLITVIFSCRGEKKYVELNENRTCGIPPFEAGRVSFGIYSALGEHEMMSSTILELCVKPSLETYPDTEMPYSNAHEELLGILQKIESGDIVANQASQADFATRAGSSETEVSLTGDQTIDGTKNFVGTLQKNGTEVASIANISNPNLLINGDFRVNQRGAASYTGSGSRLYTVDRWAITSSASVTSIKTDAISVTLSAQYQAFEQKIEDYEKLKGKTVTLSCKISNVEISSGNQLFLRYNSGDTTGTKQITGDGTYSLTFTVSNSATLLAVQIFSGSGSGITYSFDLEWMKLEIGSVATPFSPRPYAEELALCQRYYQIINSTYQYGIICTGMQSSTTNCNVIVLLNAQMRISPTLIVSDVSHFRVHCGYTIFKVPTSVSKNSYQTNGVCLSVSFDAVSTSDKPVELGFNNSSGYLAFDAEIY